MPFGPVASTSSAAADVVAPGIPGFGVVKQKDNESIDVEVVLPTTDSDGTALTGLKRLVVATVALDEGGADPTAGLDMPSILGLDGVQSQEIPIEPADAGATKKATVPIVNLGGTQVIVAACADD